MKNTSRGKGARTPWRGGCRGHAIASVDRAARNATRRRSTSMLGAGAIRSSGPTRVPSAASGIADRLLGLETDATADATYRVGRWRFRGEHCSTERAVPCAEQAIRRDTPLGFRKRVSEISTGEGLEARPPRTRARRFGVGRGVRSGAPRHASRYSVGSSLSCVRVSKSEASWRSWSCVSGSPNTRLTIRPRATAGRASIALAQRMTLA